VKWVTRQGVKFDRSACAWLIRRFIDPQAEFAYLPAEEMPAAIAAGATPFHDYAFVRGTPPPADRVNLPRLISDYQLDQAHPALTLFAESVRNGERAGWAKAGAEHEGLWAIGNGMRALAQDDADFVERMRPVYDALYAYCEQRAAGGSGWTSDS
jgi:hypothetical protein